MADVSLSLDPMIGTAATAAAGAFTWFLRQLVRDRRTRTAIAEEEAKKRTAALEGQALVLVEIKGLLAGLARLAELAAVLEERTRWMVRERRPTPLREDGTPEEVDAELTPVDGLREARARARTPPRGRRPLGRYGPQGGGRDPDDA